MAVVYAELVREMWRGNKKSIAPWNIKKALAKHAP
jgi:hypothetical protein